MILLFNAYNKSNSLLLSEIMDAVNYSSVIASRIREIRPFGWMLGKTDNG